MKGFFFAPFQPVFFARMNPSDELIIFFQELIPFENTQLVFEIIKYVFLTFVALLIGFVASRVIMIKLEQHSLKKFARKIELLFETDCNGLIKKCASLGHKIDVHTNRTRNSRKVSNLVYMISRNLNLDSSQCLFNTCAAMVYDVGFLDIDSALFHADILSPEEKKSFPLHVSDWSLEMELPEEAEIIFENAIKFHHENEDGTGYPQKISSEEIPLIARIIHLTESYVSLTSKRSWHKALSPKKAIATLNKRKSIYSEEVFESLKKIIR